VDYDIVWRIERLAVELIGDRGDRAVGLEPHHTPHAVLARNLPALVIERVPVAVVRGAEGGDVAVLFRQPHLPVVRDVAPHQITSRTAPGAAFGPSRSRPQPLDGGIADLVFVEAFVERHDVGVGITDRLFARPVALTLRERRGRKRGSSEKGTSLQDHGAIVS